MQHQNNSGRTQFQDPAIVSQSGPQQANPLPRESAWRNGPPEGVQQLQQALASRPAPRSAAPAEEGSRGGGSRGRSHPYPDRRNHRGRGNTSQGNHVERGENSQQGGHHNGNHYPPHNHNPHHPRDRRGGRGGDNSDRRGRGRGGRGGDRQQERAAQRAEETAPLPPPKHDPDPEVLERFKTEYAKMGEEEGAETQPKVHKVLGTINVDECYELIEKNDVVFIVTDTGTGKSTLVPKKVLDTYPDAKIVSAQPRRTATINLAQRVAQLLGEDVGKTVGYSVRGEHVGEMGETPLMYVTNYTLFLYLLWRSPENIGFTHIFIDEIHERSAEVELMVLILKLALLKYPKKFKLILCSASAVMDQWRSFFEAPLTVEEYSNTKIMYPIHTYNAEEIAKLVGCTYLAPEVRNDSVVTSLQLQHIMLMVKETLRFLAQHAAPQHSILVFLPGRTPVEHITKWIKDHLGEQLDPIAWYRDVDLSVIQAELARETFTRKKVYVATDIAEVSLTLPDVVFVIDSGTCKRPMVTEKNSYSVAFPPLQLLWESPNNYHQRRGRIGRVQPGFFFSMVGKEQSSTLDETDNPVANSVLHELVLHSLQITSSPLAMFALCREKPRQIGVQHSLLTLRDGGFLFPKDDELAASETVVPANDQLTNASAQWNGVFAEPLAATLANNKKLAEGSNTEDDPVDANRKVALYTQSLIEKEYQMTIKGLIASIVPTCIEAGATVFYSLLFGMPVLGIYMASVEACRSPFYVPYDISDREEKKKYSDRVSAVMRSYQGEHNSDIISCVSAVLEYLDMQRDGLSEDAQVQWCEERFLSRTRIIDILNLVKQMKEQVAAELPFPDIDDIDVLRAQMKKSAALLNALNIAAHMQWAVYVERDGEAAIRRGFVGRGVFIKMNCVRDQFVPTVCPWRYRNICVPLSLFTMYNRLMCTFASQINPTLFNVLVLVFSHRVVYEPVESGSVLFSVTYMQTTASLECDKLTSQQILQLRRIICARMCVLQLQVERRVRAEDKEAIAEHLESVGCDFGIPDNFKANPQLIPNLLQSGLTSLMQRIEEGTRQPLGPQGSRPSAYCWATARPPVPLAEDAMQSVLQHSGNGIMKAQESTKNAMFNFSKPSAAKPQEGGAMGVILESDSDPESEDEKKNLHFSFE